MTPNFPAVTPLLVKLKRLMAWQIKAHLEASFGVYGFVVGDRRFLGEFARRDLFVGDGR